MNLGFGFPAVVAVSPSKSKLAIMKGSFAEEKLGDFLNDLINGRAALEDVKNKLAFKKADKWDGKDAPPLDVSIITLLKLKLILITYSWDHHQTTYDQLLLHKILE